MSGLASKIGPLMKAGADIAAVKLKKFGGYAAVELTPPTPGEIGAAFGSLGKVIKTGTSGAVKNLTVKEAWVNTLVATEILCWFFVGECIGKKSIVGYQV